MKKSSRNTTEKTFSHDYINSLPTIGVIARRYGLTLRALRFYEERGIISPIRIGAVRFFDEQSEGRVRKILEAKRLGYTMRKIKDLLQSGASDLDTILDGKRIMDRIAELRQNRDAIDRAIAALQGAYRKMPNNAEGEGAKNETASRQRASSPDL